jgi:hypothetical protein
MRSESHNRRRVLVAGAGQHTQPFGAGGLLGVMVTQNRIGLFLAEDPAGKGACFRFLFGEPGGDHLFGRLFERAMHRAEILHRRDRAGKIRYFRAIPYGSALFRQAARFFLASFGVREVAAMIVKGRLSGAEFIPIDLEQVRAESGGAADRPREGRFSVL